MLDSVPIEDKVKALLMIGEAISKLPDVKPARAMAFTLASIQTNTGLMIKKMLPILSLSPEHTIKELE